jgi:hypothetical protein
MIEAARRSHYNDDYQKILKKKTIANTSETQMQYLPPLYNEWQQPKEIKVKADGKKDSKDPNDKSFNQTYISVSKISVLTS